MEQPTKEEKEVLGSWAESNRALVDRKVYRSISKRMILASIERTYKREIVKYWTITDVMPNSDGGFLMCWEKRMFPLDDEGLEKIFGKEK